VVKKSVIIGTGLNEPRSLVRKYVIIDTEPADYERWLRNL